jgi:mannose-1-phosphate guanylyltransferase
VRAVILVGGEGTRLRPLTLVTPKQMLPVAGRPMIERVVEHLAGHGITEVVLALGYRPDAFLAAYPDGHCRGVALRYAVEPEPLDTAGAVAFAARQAGIDETFVVVNGDVLTGLDVTALIDFHRVRGGTGTIALTPVEDPSVYGVVPTHPDGRVVAFIEKPPIDEAPTNLINAGTYVLERSVLDLIPRGRRVSIEREVFPALVGMDGLYAMASAADWIDAGVPATYLAANLARAMGCVGAGTWIHDEAVVSGSVLGDGVVVDAGARVEDSLLLDGVRVGAGALVRGSIVGPRASIGQRATVSDLSVIGYDVIVGDDQQVCGERVSSAAR